jgi:hypothetical protein
MKKTFLASLATFLVLGLGGSLLVACGGDDTVTPLADGGGKDGTIDGTTSDTGPADGGTHDAVTNDSGDAGAPPPPTLGTQIDRMGRPAINTALNHAFDSNQTTQGAAKDTWNGDKDPTKWVASYQPEVAKNLAILDSLDSNCGNQPYAQADAGADRYKTLSTVLASDMLWLNTGSAACTTYLAVELNATNVLTNTDCGGRKLDYDVIDTTYSVVSGVGLSGFGDTIAAVPAKTNGTTFPYLAPPQ